MGELGLEMDPSGVPRLGKALDRARLVAAVVCGIVIIVPATTGLLTQASQAKVISWAFLGAAIAVITSACFPRLRPHAGLLVATGGLLLLVSPLLSLDVQVASVQDFSTVGFGIGEDARANDTASLRTSVDSGESTVAEYAGLLHAQGFDSGYAVWSATWGRSIADALQTKDRLAAGAVLALNEIWYAAANQFWTYAYANSSGRSEP